ncbi:hypothetical protein ACU18_13890 [Arthrobacter sp. ZBG10]|nr:hypothetical protein ACU18_13890 [Arthrobacter sp. ZBG10]KQR00330.1 hypothetical protein ASF72_15875 [Arthrobacter sp. Leaf141]
MWTSAQARHLLVQDGEHFFSALLQQCTVERTTAAYWPGTGEQQAFESFHHGNHLPGFIVNLGMTIRVQFADAKED